MKGENHVQNTVRIIVQVGANRTYREFDLNTYQDWNEAVSSMLDSFKQAEELWFI